MLMICSHRNSKTISKLQWVSKIPPNLPYVILNGNPDQSEEYIYNEETHVVTLKCPDDYAGLPKKIKAGFRFIKDRFDPDFVFKIDDDMFVDLDKLFDSLKILDCDYAGSICHLKDRELYAAGPLYYVSRNAIGLLRDMDIHYSSAEDVCVGNCLKGVIRLSFPLYTDIIDEGKTAIAYHDHKRQFL